MLWEAYQQTQIASAGRTADRAAEKADHVNEDMRQLERQMGRLTLVCQAMWELIRDHTDFREEDLEQKILEVDVRDGNADGKIGGRVIACSHCGRNTNSARTHCLMCGAELSRPHIFE
jgi:hypothetical protein